LKSADFLDAARHPTIVFASTEVVASGPDSFEVTGNLSIRGVERPVALTVEGLTPEAKDPWGNWRRGASARTRINRKSFGLEWNVALEAGGFLVGDEVEIDIDVELIRQAS
jgi:polyisoprenoid-binding protein YceI